jgi:hypothetical protein
MIITRCRRVDMFRSAASTRTTTSVLLAASSHIGAAFRNYIAQNPKKAGLQSEEYSLHLPNVLITSRQGIALPMRADRIV